MDNKDNKISDCPLTYTTNLLGGKWKIQLIWIIYETKSIRFNELKRKLNGITDLMLTKILKELVNENIVHRQQYNEIPPHVEYSLTQHGLNLIDALSEIRKWTIQTQDKQSN